MLYGTLVLSVLFGAIGSAGLGLAGLVKENNLFLILGAAGVLTTGVLMIALSNAV